MSETSVENELRFLRHTVYKLAKAIKTDVCDCDSCFLLKIRTEQENSTPPRVPNLEDLQNSCFLKSETTTDPDSQNEPISSISMKLKHRKLNNSKNIRKARIGRPSKIIRKEAWAPTLMKDAKIPLQRCDHLLRNGNSIPEIELDNDHLETDERSTDLNLSLDYLKSDDSRRRSRRRLSLSPSRFESFDHFKVPRTSRFPKRTTPQKQLFPSTLIIDL